MILCQPEEEGRIMDNLGRDVNLNFNLMLEERGIPLVTLSDVSGVGLTKISKLIKGAKSINMAQAYTVYRLAEALKCDVKDIIEKQPVKRMRNKKGNHM